MASNVHLRLSLRVDDWVVRGPIIEFGCVDRVLRCASAFFQQKWVPGVFPGGKGGQCVRLTTLPPSCAVVRKSGNLNFLEPSGPLQACNGTALLFYCAKRSVATSLVGRIVFALYTQFFIQCPKLFCVCFNHAIWLSTYFSYSATIYITTWLTVGRDSWGGIATR